MRSIYIIIIAVLGITTNQVMAQEAVYPFHSKDKKIIVFQGAKYWEWSSDLQGKLEKMQTSRPGINGVVFHIGSTYGQPTCAFNNEIWTEKSLRFDALDSISRKWTSFTDNFILVWGESKNVNPDFFDDSLWNRITSNAELLGKAVHIAGCKGIMFDPEFYSHSETYSPWWYSKNSGQSFKAPYAGKGQSFELVNAKARQRGKQFVQALQVHMPRITIMTTFLFGCVWDYCYNDISKLENSEYALLSGFASGMVEGLNPGSIIVDGNETSYYIDESRKYIEESDHNNYKFVRCDVPFQICDYAVAEKLRKQGQIAMAPYLDLYCNRYSPKDWSTPAYQSKWITHNIYHSLLISDQYVWIYVESLNFWTGENAPPDLDLFEAIQSGIEKFRNGKALGYDMIKPSAYFTWQTEKQAEFVFSPSITLTASSVFNLPEDITITASIWPDSAIEKVEFYINSLKAGEARSAPYIITTKFGKNKYTVFARVFTRDGKHTSSAPLYIGKE